MKILLRCVVVGFTFALWVTVASAKNAVPDLKSDKATAKDIIMQMADVYKNCKSYSDTGMVKTTFLMKNGTIFVKEKPFSTAFVRPNQFRFEYTSKFSPKSKSYRYIIWAKGKEVLTWWDVKPGIKKKVSLRMAIAGATGVSGSSAHTVPVLLMPKIGGRSFAKFKEGKRISDSLLNGTMCYRIQGNLKLKPISDSLPNSAMCSLIQKNLKSIRRIQPSITLWINQNTFLIHQIDKSSKFPKFRTKATTTYKAKINIEIAKNDLAFNAPVKDSNQLVK